MQRETVSGDKLRSELELKLRAAVKQELISELALIVILALYDRKPLEEVAQLLNIDLLDAFK